MGHSKQPLIMRMDNVLVSHVILCFLSAFAHSQSTPSACFVSAVPPCPSFTAPSPYGAGFIPVTNTGICAEPPGLVTTNGCDDVCILAAMCCNGWGANNGGNVKLPNGVQVSCSSVNCGNVCRMVCDRTTRGVEACNKNCSMVTSTGAAYVFMRPGFCIRGVANPFSPTHVGFGFEVSPGVFLFGSVENSGGSPVVLPGFDNGFWMTTGTVDQMMATFRDPSYSCFHGMSQGYTAYKMTVVQNPSVCAAVSFAETLYTVGYGILTDNCLDAVFSVLGVYGVKFTPDLNPSINVDVICPGDWFNALPSPAWTASQPAVPCVNPVRAIPCSSNVPASCSPPTSPVNCFPVYVGGGCIVSANPFQGLTSACPCAADGISPVPPGTALKCSCGSGSGGTILPTCTDNSIVIGPNSGCGVCNCPAQSAFCNYFCTLGEL